MLKKNLTSMILAGSLVFGGVTLALEGPASAGKKSNRAKNKARIAAIQRNLAGNATATAGHGGTVQCISLPGGGAVGAGGPGLLGAGGPGGCNSVGGSVTGPIIGGAVTGNANSSLLNQVSPIGVTDNSVD